ncbi:TolC family protein [Persicobacter psychrovividus]|uniref:Transporter n=1 Tax=Persicobacter psychrovividus TaxID=387638 RepID=A0ABN6LCW1_9BACT|nr:transporter [Persicobacter psychrovividus]
MRRWKMIFCACLVMVLVLEGANSLQAQNISVDSMRVEEDGKAFSLDEFYQIILDHHPLVKQAQFLSPLAQEEIRYARGSFDPKAQAKLKQKVFESKNYYQLFDGYISVPTWVGVDFKAGYESASGINVNPEHYVPDQGLMYAGVSVPIGKGLIMDARRLTLRKAQIGQQMAEADRLKMINKVLLSAAKDYWQWYMAYRNFQVAEEIYELAGDRFEAVRENVLNGEEAPIDSVQALINYQNRSVTLREAEIGFVNASLVISNYLWDAEMNPLQIEGSLYPVYEDLMGGYQSEAFLAKLIEMASISHPDLVKLDAKARQLILDKRWAVESLKPELNVNYNLINEQLSLSNSKGDAVFNNNYKWGFDFSIPIFLRKERAKLKMTKIKMEQVDFDRVHREKEINTEVLTLYNQLVNTAQLLDIQRSMVINYSTMLNGEQQMFNAGESSLFLVNTRESQLLEANQKLLKLEVTLEKDKAQLLWAAGVENLDFFAVQ